MRLTALALLALLPACAASLGPEEWGVKGQVGDALVCRGGCSVVWRDETVTISTQSGEIVWTGPLSRSGLGAVALGGLFLAGPTGAGITVGAAAAERIIDAAVEEEP